MYNRERRVFLCLIPALIAHQIFHTELMFHYFKPENLRAHPGKVQIGIAPLKSSELQLLRAGPVTFCFCKILAL